MTTQPIVFLTGLGADARLFGPQRVRWPDAVLPEWPFVDRDEHTADGFAARLRTAVDADGLWTDRTVLVGFSFGGQIALTMAALALREDAPVPAAIVLISAPRATKGLTRRFRAQVRSADWLPAELVAGIARSVIAPRFSALCGLNASDSATLRAMADDLDVHVLRAHARVATHWQFTRDDEQRLADAGVHLEHIHAMEDPVIPGPPRTTPGVTWVPGRRHLLTWTHAEIVNDAIERALAAGRISPAR